MDHPSPEAFRQAVLRLDPDQWPHAGRLGLVVGEGGVVAHAQTPATARRFSLGATFLGWAVATFFSLFFLGLAALLVGVTGFLDPDLVDNAALEAASPGGIVGYLVATFAGYLIGGYAAGRIALWDGVKHGVLIVGWSLGLAAVAVVVGAFGGAPVVVAPTLAAGPVALAGLAAVILTLAVMIGAAAIGGRLGERYHDRAHAPIPRSPERRTRGRPL